MALSARKEGVHDFGEHFNFGSLANTCLCQKHILKIVPFVTKHCSGLPDFLCTTYQNGKKYTKCSQNVPNSYK
jgi:hypothetical protein